MDIPQLILSAMAALIALTIHEYAHGYVAYKLGDGTAKAMGRLSLNPIKHIDIVGAICMLFFRFGWAKPVPVDERNFRHGNRSKFIVSIAGVLMNIVLGIGFLFVYMLIFKWFPEFYYASATKRVVIFIENEAFEFQFMRKYFDWEYVFSLDERRPVAALTTLGIEFRCSYILSGYSLEKIGENLMTYKCKKLVGQYDYSKIRHSDTPLTQTELNYCEMDVRVIMAYIQEKIEEDGSIANILLTNTSYVRQYVRRYTLYNKDPLISKDYKKIIKIFDKLG